MKLWILRPAGYDISDGGLASPWHPWYDKAFGFVIAAETGSEARRIAAERGGDENPHYNKPDGSPWLDSQQSTCVPLDVPDYAGVVMMDFCSA